MFVSMPTSVKVLENGVTRPSSGANASFPPKTCHSVGVCRAGPLHKTHSILNAYDVAILGVYVVEVSLPIHSAR
jgi:hypothetical protein